MISQGRNMEQLKGFCFVFLWIFLSFCLFLYECRKLDEIPVYSTEFCPRNQKEYNERSSAINCTENYGYLCFPNKDLTEFLESCYTSSFMWIEADYCIYFTKPYPRVNSYNCRGFQYGCHNASFPSTKLYEHPSCTSIKNGCFIAEPSCQNSTLTATPLETTEEKNISWSSLSTMIPPETTGDIITNSTTFPFRTTNNVTNRWFFAGPIFGVFTLTFCISLLFAYHRKENQICKRNCDVEQNIGTDLESSPFLPTEDTTDAYPILEENQICKRNCDVKQNIGTDLESSPFLQTEDTTDAYPILEESRPDLAVFKQWEKENKQFVPTRACKEVEKFIKSENLVIVTGNPGSGKSAIIQHIALGYKRQGWTVKPVYSVKEIIDAYSSEDVLQNHIFFVYNDPFGNEFFDNVAYYSWISQEERIESCLRKVKILLSCRKYILNDPRVKGLFRNLCRTVDLSDDHLRLSYDEKQKIWKNHSLINGVFKDEIDEIFQIDAYFPLLCKLYIGKENTQEERKERLHFFKHPLDVIEKEIRNFRNQSNSCVEKYCALILLVLFNNHLCIEDILTNELSLEKFKLALRICGMKTETAPTTIKDALESLQDFFVKKIGDTFHFYHDVVMERTTYVFGTDYPLHTIKYADIGFLRTRIRIGGCSDKKEQMIVYLEDRYINDLGKRLIDEIFGERLLDVVLNPCLKNERITNMFIEEFKKHPDKLQMLLEEIKLPSEMQNVHQTSKQLLLSTFLFVTLKDKISPINAFIVFSHTSLARNCLNILKQMPKGLRCNFLFSAVCCNGSLDLFSMFVKEYNNDDILSETWESLSPVHIVSAFHSHEILQKLIEFGVDVNLKTATEDYWTPLTLAAGNNAEKNDEDYDENKIQANRDITVHILLCNGAEIDLCDATGASPLFVSCGSGHESTAHILLSNKAKVNLCRKDGTSPLLVACGNGHESSVKLLLRYEADVDLCRKDGFSPLMLACLNGHKNIIQYLLEKKADINLRNANGFGPLHVACKKGDCSNVELLLKYGADINLCDNHGNSPLYVACFKEHATVVQHLLSYDANINLCNTHGLSPLLLACSNGNECIIQYLLTKKANVNLRNVEGTSPLLSALETGHYDIVHLLLSNGADINLCDMYGTSPLIVACNRGHNSSVQLLLSYGANVNLCDDNGISPLSNACYQGHDNVVQILLENKADINFCDKNGASPFLHACRKGHTSTVELLLGNGADINRCDKNGVSPFLVACTNGHETIALSLLRNGSDINLCDVNRVSPILGACRYGHDDIVQHLLSNGADINLCDTNGTSPFLEACERGCDKIVQRLLSRGADINKCDGNGISPLLIACQEGHDSLVQLLLINGADINITYEDGVGPFFEACRIGHDNIVLHLLCYNANINLCNVDRVSPLFIACQNGHKSTVQHLLNKGANIGLLRNDGASPFLEACRNGHESIVELLLKKEADINLCDANGVSPLLEACRKGHYNIVKLLLSNEADINSCDGEKSSPLFLACANGHDAIVQLLLSKGADIDQCDACGFSPIAVACGNEHTDIVKQLLENKANINLCSKSGVSPLLLSCQEGHESIVELLLNNEAETDLCDKDGISPVYIACQYGDDNILNLLLRKKADINRCKKNGFSPLLIACQEGNTYNSTAQRECCFGTDIKFCDKDRARVFSLSVRSGHEQVVQLLLSKEANVNQCDENGASPLFLACGTENESIVKHLVSNGADVNLCDFAGVSPLYIACLKGHDNIVQILLSNGANINLWTKYGSSPLYIAFAFRNCEIVKTLLESNANSFIFEGCIFKSALFNPDNRDDRTMTFLMQRDNIIDELHDSDSYFSLFVFCQAEQILRIVSRTPEPNTKIRFTDQKVSNCCRCCRKLEKSLDPSLISPRGISLQFLIMKNEVHIVKMHNQVPIKSNAIVLPKNISKKRSTELFRKGLEKIFS